MAKAKTLLVVLGPTAIGKTSLAIQLAQYYRTEILSCDSRQFYRQLNIGVARPDENELSLVRHHFIGFLDIHERFSAGDFEQAALNELEKIFLTNDVAICVGGSGLYLDALVNGFDDLPHDAAVRAELIQLHQTKGLEPLREELKHRDPEYFSKVDLSNPHRLIRALEVCRITGGAFSSLRSGNTAQRHFNVVKVGLKADRAWLNDRINRRVEAMVNMGLVEEVRALLPFKNLNALNTVGYKELFEALDQNTSLQEAIESIKLHTRQYAKRQVTWWNRDPDIHWFDADKNEKVEQSVISFLSHHFE